MSEPTTLQEATARLIETEEQIRLGGGERGIERQHRHGRLTARERIELLADKGTTQFECGLFIAHNMYEEFGGAPSAGVVTTIAQVGGKYCMVVANDATVKAGAFFPMTCKKIIRAQTIAQRARLPLLYLVDSAGVFLPLQEDHSGTNHRPAGTAPPALPRRLRWCISSPSGRRLSRYR